jgi:hypothetical protein
MDKNCNLLLKKLHNISEASLRTSKRQEQASKPEKKWLFKTLNFFIF